MMLEMGGGSLAEPIAPNSIRSDALRQTDPSITDRVASPTPPVGRRRHTRLPPVPKWEHALTSSDQVMIQIELPPNHGPRSPLDLVTIEIIFGCLFEVFQHVSQDAGTGTSTDIDNPPKKKTRQPSLKKILVPR
jgi:hypothetical protein